MQTKLYPLSFEPIYKERIWGGRALERVLGRMLPAGQIGESWEVAAHAHGMSVVKDGPLKGQTLENLVALYQENLLGVRGLNDQGRFPLLLKFIHAEEDLSVQVHPDDLDNRDSGEDAKTELWYIIDAKPGAWIVWGLKRGVSHEQFAHAIAQGGAAIVECLNKVAVKPGEVYPISAGLVHALGAGVVVAEIQQNSDTTYRVYDWDRLDSQGQARELHVDKALAVIDFSDQALSLSYQLARCAKHFKLTVLENVQDLLIELEAGFQILTCLQGTATITYLDQTIVMKKGESYLMPACLGSFVCSSSGVVLQYTLP